MLQNSPLGQVSAYIDQYTPGLLFPIARAGKRAEIGVDLTQGAAPFFGADMWTAFELSWLNLRGKPQVALAHFTVPCESPNIIESKSFKLYLNSFNNTRFANSEEVKARLRADLSEAVWRDLPVDPASTPPALASVVDLDEKTSIIALKKEAVYATPAATIPSIGITIIQSELFDREPVRELDGLSLDRLDIDCADYTPAPHRLTVTANQAPVTEVLTSNLLKSNCLVTGQPDWGSVQISYTGDPIDQEGLLQYLVSFRNHDEFHEQCVERIFMDIWTRCKPLKLAVYARYTRRGGLDINPYRTSHPAALPQNIRHARQ